ncbi:glycosyltransferase family 4 protein [Methylobacterium sp. WL19]|uniref:glycosyltransferase family 4 protein n=1 Tax=Methylobacterium sp. WL19 TaxID=2603896 RepID=UPI0011C7D07E|nr:glycosyltransferase family 4 protein [Methylobacterium sp. WL19]TXN23663.1 glycosyltransferase family 4 protein [Methylobacterium sp. WL19]
MRTALLAWDYPPAPSGLSTAAREIAESLSALGVTVTVFTLDRTGSGDHAGVGIEGIGLPPGSRLARLRLWGSAGHLAAPIAFRRAVLRAHARHPFDCIEATNWYGPAALLGGGAAPPLVTRNSTPAAFSREPAASLRDRLDGLAADRLERRQARASAGLISNTGEHAARMTALYGLQPARPHTVRPHTVRPHTARPHAVIGLSLPPEMLERGRAAPYPEATGGPVRLLFVGRAEPRKGFDLLLAAAAILGADCEAGTLPPFEIALVGVPEADLPPDCPAAARRRLRPLGRIDAVALEAAYARAHVVLAPSRYESFGLVYQEALAHGRPVVACAQDASARAFIGGPGAGLLAREATGAALAEAIRPLLLDSALRLRLRDRALSASGAFDRARLGAETLALYERAIAAARQGR